MTKLEGSLAKLRRARNQVKALNDTIMQTLEGYTYRVVIAEPDPKPGYRVMRIETEHQGLPIEWSVLAGEIAHNLRSALNLLMYQLALLNPATKQVAHDIEFPIFLVGTTKRQRRGRRGHNMLIPHFKGRQLSDGLHKIRQLLPEHQTAIERLQPYHRGNGQRFSPLWLLHELNNADKHRLIQVVVLASNRIQPTTITLTRDPTNVASSPVLRDIELKQRVPLENGAKVGRIAVDFHGGSVEMDSRFTTQVFFNQGCDAVIGLDFMEVLVGAVNAVNEVLSLFLTDPDLQ